MGSFEELYSLRSVTDLPAPFRSTFSFRYFNSLQSECFPICFLSDFNMVISAPTGSGKTVLFELCIVRLLSRFLSPEGKFNHMKGVLKTIYIAPSKALVQEKLRDWNLKLGSWGINCLEMTGDNESHNTKNIQEADIILTTPEKFDAVTRHGVRDGGLSFFSDIALMLIDEVHLLNDPRGAALEAIVSRTKMLSRIPDMRSTPLADVRFIAVSATIPNIEDLAEWLLVPPQGIKRFGEEMRPVKLTTKVFGYAPARNDFLFERRLQNFIFVGYHNGGLCLKDRNLIEGLFLKGDVQVLCTTNTLAYGINLPAHTVIIKSTQYFNKEKGLYAEYERSMVLQMCGRAGRPPFDDTGIVIIMTRKETVHLYENLLNGCEMIESQLLSCAIEHLNAEIVQLMVSDISLAIEWLKCSYLYVRIRKNPEYYGIKRGIPSERLEKHVREICVQKINELSEHGMIWTDEDGFLLKPLEPGKLMTKYYLKFDTMKLIVKAPESCSLEDMLHIITHSAEIAWIQLRRNEKKLLNDIHSDKEGRLRFHLLGENGKRKKRIQTREDKIFVLANDSLTGDPLIHDLSLSQDASSICLNGYRIAKCMKECFIYRKSYKGAINSMLLAKCLHQRLWDNSPYLLKQLPGIGMVTAKALQTAGIDSFQRMEEADPRKIEIVTGRKYPFGNHIKESLLSLPPKIEIEIAEAEWKRKGNSKLLITLTRLPQPVSPRKHHYADLVVGSKEDNVILFHEKMRADEFSSPCSVNVLVPCPQNGRVTVKADLIFEEYVGLDIHKKYVISSENSSRKMRGHVNEVPARFHSLPREICAIDDDNNTSSEITTDIQDIGNTGNLSSAPSFDLLQEENGRDKLVTEQEETEDEVNNVDCLSKVNTDEMVFDHIRKKSKNFPTLLPSKAMAATYEPEILTRKRTPKNQFELNQSGLHVDDVIMIDSEQNYQTSLKYNNASFSEMSHIQLRDEVRSNVNVQSEKISSHNILKDVHFQGVGCKRAYYAEESDAICEKQDYRIDTPSDLRGGDMAVSFLGFKSVFSFL
ncbi:ATP-dependent DNA helicase MER3 homolog isoform X3 [Ananas comosus]|uniref:DNA 3'-5' helicase n=1 Tax=Ananas comosus TaxID=4615 RepID=A0A6P5FVR6_ANACO|nr:ATP-dependent DNA helicase MER3 homolog isoform X3 [Ananas comosus]